MSQQSKVENGRVEGIKEIELCMLEGIKEIELYMLTIMHYDL